jgi:branched-chain amino acid transport system permease protein
MEYFLHILIMIGIYSLVAYSLNLTMGYCGLLNLAPAAFYGIGAYGFTLVMTKANLFQLVPGLSFFISLICAALLTGIIAFLSGIPALKFRKDSFVLVTLAFQVIIFTVLYNWIPFTKGPYGISGIPRPNILGWQIDALWEYLILIVLINALVLVFLFKLYQSPFGLSLKALRDDEIGAQSIGISARKQFLRAFTIAGAFIAIPGALYACYVTYIDPTSFGLEESIFQVVILSLGGTGNRKGPIIGVLFMIILPEILREIGLPDTIAPNVRQMVYGAVLVFLMFVRPQGLWGEFKPK